MNWVTIDIGTAEIKASVLDLRNRPSKLSYTMSGYSTTHLPNEVAVSTEGEIITGDDATLLRMMGSDTARKKDAKDVWRAIFMKIHNAAKEYYKEEAVGAVIMYDEPSGCNAEKEEIAKEVFSEMQTMNSSDVINKAIPELRKGLNIILDFGAENFKISISNNGEYKSFSKNSDLGFSKLDISPLIGNVGYEALNTTELLILGEMVERLKIALNNRGDVNIPPCISTSKESIIKGYEQIITKFLYKCFDECFNSLSSVSKKWDDVDNIIFIGGGANCKLMDAIFERYMEGKGCNLHSYNRLNHDFDPQYASTHCAISIPLYAKAKVRVIGLHKH